MSSQRLQRLQAILLLTSTRSDAFLTHLARLLSTSKGIDATLLTVQYFLTFVHSQLVRVLTNKYERLAISIASKASETMLPGEALVATIEAPHVTLTEWCAGVKSLGDTTDDVRTFMRYVPSLRSSATLSNVWQALGTGQHLQLGSHELSTPETRPCDQVPHLGTHLRQHRISVLREWRIPDQERGITRREVGEQGAEVVGMELEVLDGRDCTGDAETATSTAAEVQ